MDTDDRDAHPPAMRWLFGEYTAAEAGNRPGLRRPTRREGGTCHPSPQGSGSGTGSFLLHYFSTNRVDSRGLRWIPVDSTAANKRLTSTVLDHKLRVVSQLPKHARMGSTPASAPADVRALKVPVRLEFPILSLNPGLRRRYVGRSAHDLVQRAGTSRADTPVCGPRFLLMSGL